MTQEGDISVDSQASRAALALNLSRLPELARHAPHPERTKALVCRGLFDTQQRALRVGRFELLRALGRGGMGVVYEALDTRSGERLAVKMLHEQGAAELYRLKSEFRSLQGLTHANLVVLHDLYVQAEGAFFSMELVRGQDFTCFASEATLSQLELALGQLAGGLCALHAAGKLHRDLKPHNVLVSEAGQVKLLDFGLAAAAAAVSGCRAGTPAYMAPEQARGEASEASDWFGFGALLQQALAVRRARGHACAPALVGLAQQLVLPDVSRRAGPRDVEVVLRAGLAATGRSAPPFLGREHTLSQLAAAFAQSARGPVVLRVRGESGIGKSALLTHFCETLAKQAGARVLHGRCYERESLPYKGLDGLMDELSQVLIGAARDARLAPARARALLQVFPVLARVTDLRRAAALAPAGAAFDQGSAVQALRELLWQLTAEQPLVLCIDDVQWADADSGRMLGALLGDDAAPPLLLLCTDRNDSVSTSQALAELQRVAAQAPGPLCQIELELGPLADAEARQLAAALLDARPELTDRLVSESRGSPLLVTELAHVLGATPHVPDAPLSLDALFERRVRDLAPEARMLLQLTAAAGRPVLTTVVARAGRLHEACARSVAELRRARLVRAVLQEGGELLALHHDRIAAAALSGLTARQRRGLHARLARALQAHAGPGCDSLLDQYLAAERPYHAARCALREGRAALEALAFERAARLLSLALAHGAPAGAERVALECDLALALEHAGQPLEAAMVLQRAAASCNEPFAMVQLEKRAAQHLLRSGQQREGLRLLRQCYARLGLHWPRGRLQLVLSSAYLLLRAALGIGRSVDWQRHALYRARAELTGSSSTALEQLDVLRAVHNTLVCMDVAPRVPEPGWRLCIQGTYGLLRCAALTPGGAARGLRQLEQAHAAAAQLLHTETQRELSRLLAFAYSITGHPAAALAAARDCERALRALRLPPLERYELVSIAGYALYEMGELQTLARSWRELMHEARMHVDPLIKLWVHVHPARLALALAANDRQGSRALLEDQAQLCAACPEQRGIDWAQATCEVENALYWGHWQRAQAELHARHAALFGSGYAFLTRRARELRVRCALAAACALSGRPRARALAAAARDAARLRVRACGLHVGRARLLDAQLAAAKGEDAQALRALAAALPELEREQARLLTACAQQLRGALLGGEHGRCLQLQARAALRAHGICDPERWAEWTLPGLARVEAARADR